MNIASAGASLRTSRAVHRILTRLASAYASGPEFPDDDDIEEPESIRIETNRISLSALRYKAPLAPLVFLHGVNNNAWSWIRVAHALKEQRSVLSLSQRGHGQSSAPQTGYSLIDTTADLLGALDKLELSKIDLAGHSWGGKVAMHFAASYPGRVNSLILADPVSPLGLNPLLNRFPALVTASLRAERGPYCVDDDLEDAGKHLIYLRHWKRLDQRLWRENFVQDPSGVYHHTLGDAAFDEIFQKAIHVDIRKQAESIECPVLLLLPTLTISFFPGELRAFRRIFPTAKIRPVRGDHTFIHSNPVETASLIADFFQTCSKPIVD